MASEKVIGIDESNFEKISSWTEHNDYYNFKEAENKDIYLLAVALGYDLIDDNTKINYRNGGYFRESTLKPTDYALIISLYLDKVGAIEKIVATEELVKFIEKSAHRGFQIIEGELDKASPKHFEKEKIAELNRRFKEIRDASTNTT